MFEFYAKYNRAETMPKRCALKNAADNCRNYRCWTFLVPFIVALLRQINPGYNF